MWIVQPCWFHLSMTTSQKNHPLVEESIPLDIALFWLQYDWTKSQIHQKSNQPKPTYSKCMLSWNKTPPQQKQWFYCKKTQNIYTSWTILCDFFWVENLTFSSVVRERIERSAVTSCHRFLRANRRICLFHMQAGRHDSNSVVFLESNRKNYNIFKISQNTWYPWSIFSIVHKG